jgi:hypothetical protein
MEGQGLINVVQTEKILPLKTDEQVLVGPLRRHLNVFADEPSSAPSPGVCVLLL